MSRVFIRVRFGDGDVERYAKHAVDMLAIVRAVSVAHALAHIGVQKGVSFAFHCGPSLIAHEEIEDVPAIRSAGLVKFRIAALRATDGDETLVLDIEYLGEVSACSLELIVFKTRAPALGADVLALSVFHACHPP